MERISLFQKLWKRHGIILTVFFTFIACGTYAQNKQFFQGKITDGTSNLPVPFANVVLCNDSDVSLSSGIGTMSNENGIFNLGPVQPGKFRVLVSSVGYKKASEVVEVSQSEVTDAGEIVLHDSTFMIEEAMVVAERIKAKTESDKTVFFVSKKTTDVSNTGTDVLKYIPGVQVDLKQNITLEGSSNILIYVDGIERSTSYVSQLNPAQIDKVEIISTPPSGYDSNVTGVINIILKKERNAGISGHVNADLPTSVSEAFLFPSMNISYSFKKINLFASYNGEINYENIDECVYREKGSGLSATEISSVQDVRQWNLSNKFHYGFDYFINKYNQFNFYGFYNPYSYEQNGDVSVIVSGSENQVWNARRNENDRNSGVFNSLYYKRLFNREGSELSVDISNYRLNSDNEINYVADEEESGMPSYLNFQSPKQNTFSVKTDLTLTAGDKFVINPGVKAKFQTMHDKKSDNFSYSEGIFAGYVTVNFKQAKTSFNAGLRAEDSEAELKTGARKPVFSVLPYFTFNYKLSSRQNLKVAFNRTINRPSMYQLNSFTTYDNPYFIAEGNPMLTPEFITGFSIEHAVQVKSSYFSTRLFYNQRDDALNYLTTLNDTGVFVTQMQNLGTIRQMGVQFLGALKAGPVTFNPVIRVYNISTSGNQFAGQSGVKNRSEMVIEPGFSSIVSFKNDFNLSLIFQYATPKNNIQDNSYCGALYFISLDKKFKNNIKVSFESALPFTRNFIYAGSEIKAPDFYSRYEGNLKLSSVPMWIKISYQFHSGANREKIERSKEEIDQRQKKGF